MRASVGGMLALVAGSIGSSCVGEVGYQPELVYAGESTTGYPIYSDSGHYWLYDNA